MVTRGENVKKKISELMDGELENTDAAVIINAVKNDSDLFSDWEVYHAIRDSLQQSIVSIDVSEKIRDKLADEPVPLIPRLHKDQQNRRQKLLGFSVAASITVLSAGWLIFHSMEQRGTALKEIYVAEKTDNKVVPVNEQRSLVTFQPAPSYLFPSISTNSNYPLSYRGVTYENTVRYPSTGMSPAAESAQAQTATSPEQR